jgi:hypothetical protein
MDYDLGLSQYTIVGWGFLIFADFAISSQYDLLEAAAFNYGSVTVRYADEAIVNENVTRISLGLRAASVSTSTFDIDNLAASSGSDDEARRVIGFGDFCTEQETLDGGIELLQPGQCNSCAEASQALVISIIMSTVTYFFTLTTDIVRIWPKYDVNCQKVFGAFFALFSTIMGLRTFFLYQAGRATMPTWKPLTVAAMVPLTIPTCICPRTLIGRWATG